MKVVLIAQAQADLAGISEPLRSKVLKRIAALAAYPELGAPLGEDLAGFCGTTVRPFRIVYRRTSPDSLAIAYIRHCRRGRILP